jgi:hypothetical protein
LSEELQETKRVVDFKKKRILQFVGVNPNGEK